MFKLFLVIIISFGAKANVNDHVIEDHEDGEHNHGSHLECPLPQSIDDIVSCSLQYHPEVIRSDLRVQMGDKLVEKASQIPNPYIQGRFVKGEDRGNELLEEEINLAFTIELGGKRSARKDYAQSVKKKSKKDKSEILSEVKVQTVLSLYRLRQVLDERKVFEETIKAYKKVIDQLTNIPRLSSEQLASLSVFELAYDQSKIELSELYEEEKKIEHYFHISTGHSLDEIKAFLPDLKKEWPTLSKSKSRAEISKKIEKLMAISDLAKNELEIQKSKAWPDIQIGPSLMIDKGGGRENRLIGFNMKIPFPLFHANGGGKAYARSNFERIQKNIELTKSEENHERFEQVQVYESALKTLRETLSKTNIEKKHSKVEALYLRGVISSSLFLESINQKLGFIKFRNNREMKALKALWEVYKLDGKILKVEI